MEKNKAIVQKETFKLNSTAQDLEFKKNILLSYNKHNQDILIEAKSVMDNYYDKVIILVENHKKEMKKF